MIITRTPFRVSFAGGGSDLATYYERFKGAVVSTSINKYVYLSMHPYFFKNEYLLKYSKFEHKKSIENIEHSIIKEIFKLYNISGVNLSSDADIPAGTGLASSSAFAVGLIHLCNVWNETYMDKEQMAEQACHVEIDLLKEPIGKQDQYACACGGLNFIEFEKNGQVNLEKIYLNTDSYDKLQNNLLMFYTGLTHKAGDILKEQKKNMSDDTQKIESLHKMVALAKDLKTELLHNKIDTLGDILHQNWMLKKSLSSGVSNPTIDEYYEKAMKAGAIGGKLLGAGGGGFLLFYVPQKYHTSVRNALSNLREMQFCFDNKGTNVIYYNNSSLRGRY